jgi:hypothetical protein
MTATLRPMNLGEILDRTMQIYRAKFWLFAGIAALPAIAVSGMHLANLNWLNVGSMVHPARGGAFLWNFLVSLGFYHISGIIGIPFVPIKVRLASKVINGEAATAADALQFMFARWRSYVWIGLLKLCAQLIVPELLVLGLLIPIVSLTERMGGFAGDSGLPFVVAAVAVLFGMGIALFLWFGACLSLAIPVAAIERSSGLAALGRSLKLSRNSRLRICFTWLIIFAGSWVLQFGAALFVRWIFILFNFGRLFGSSMQHVYQGTVYPIYGAILTLLGPIYPIATTLFYYDQRIRLEGYDIERMMQAAGMNAPVTPAAGDGVAASAEAGEAQA